MKDMTQGKPLKLIIGLRHTDADRQYLSAGI